MVHQRIQFARSHDDIRLAWAQCGRGPVLVKASNWLTHLQYDWSSPVWQHWMKFFSDNFRFIRFDERGCGMSDWEVNEFSADNWLPDLECVVEAADIDTPFILLGISQGAVAAVQYAAKHPERVSHLILYGGYAKGWGKRNERELEHVQAILQMMRLGWGRDNPAFRQAFTSRFIPHGTHEQMDWFNDLCRKTTSSENAVRLLESRVHVDVTGLLSRITVPTLVMHARNDEVCSYAEGVRMAAEIPGASFVELDSSNHVLLPGEPAWDAFRRALLEFTGQPVDDQQAASLQLTRREQQILTLLREGLSNSGIAGQLDISEKTVRNHLTRLYRKLGVRSRTEAIVRTRPMEDV